MTLLKIGNRIYRLNETNDEIKTILEKLVEKIEAQENFKCKHTCEVDHHDFNNLWDRVAELEKKFDVLNVVALKKVNKNKK